MRLNIIFSFFQLPCQTSTKKDVKKKWSERSFRFDGVRSSWLSCQPHNSTVSIVRQIFRVSCKLRRKRRKKNCRTCRHTRSKSRRNFQVFSLMKRKSFLVSLSWALLVEYFCYISSKSDGDYRHYTISMSLNIFFARDVRFCSRGKFIDHRLTVVGLTWEET